MGLDIDGYTLMGLTPRQYKAWSDGNIVFSREALERVLWPRVYSYGECMLTLPEMVAVRRALWTPWVNEWMQFVKSTVLGES